MLERLSFGIGGFFSGYKQMKIWVENGIAYKSCRMSFGDPDTEMIKEISEDEFIRFEKKIAEFSIGSWKKEYVNTDVLDGTQWELEYKEQGKGCRHIYGSNDFPGPWNDFIEVIGDAFSDILNEGN